MILVHVCSLILELPKPKFPTGQISGFLEMPDFLARFADATNPKTGALAFSNGRSGTIVALVSPRWDYRHGSIDRARGIIARSYGTSEGHSNVQRELREIKEKLDVERAGGGKHPWYGIFTGLRTAYRTLLGITL